MWRGSRFIWGLIVLIQAAFIAGCVERNSAPAANSERGYLFLDLEESIAAGWESEILILGPATGKQVCDSLYGCYAGHRPLKMREIFSDDEEILEVLEFEEATVGKLKGTRLRVKSHQAGEATLQFAFAVDGMEPGDGDESVDEEGNFIDSFRVEAKDLASVKLQRLVEGVDPRGPYGQCTQSGPGVYLMDSLEAYEVNLRFLKLDEEGNWLRGSGELPFSMEPEGAFEITAVEESAHLIRVKPTRFGMVTMTPDEEGESFENYFMSHGEVEAVEVRAYGLGANGERRGEVSRFKAGENFELTVHPGLSGMPLCGGHLVAHFESLTPVVCEPLGAIEARGSLALATYYGGECILRVTVPGIRQGQGLVETLAVEVGYNY